MISKIFIHYVCPPQGYVVVSLDLDSLWQMVTLLSWTVMTDGQINKSLSMDLLFQIPLISNNYLVLLGVQDSSELINLNNKLQ